MGSASGGIPGKLRHTNFIQKIHILGAFLGSEKGTSLELSLFYPLSISLLSYSSTTIYNFRIFFHIAGIGC